MENFNSDKARLEKNGPFILENNNYIENEIRKYFMDFNSQKHQICRPPDEAYLYFPKEQELFEKNDINNSKVYRKIYCVKNLTNYENENLSKFEEYIVNYNKTNINNKIIFPEEWERWDTLKFIEGSHYKFNIALQLILDHIKWRNSYFPFEIKDKSIEILEFSGFCYCHGRDHSYRPNIFIKMQIYFENINKFSFEEWQMALVFFCEYIIKYMIIPGQIEQWNLFIDFENVILHNLSEEIKTMINFFQQNYISRLNTVFVFSLVDNMEHILKLVSSLLGLRTKNKVIFINEENKEEIFLNCNKEQIEEKYGGTAKNLYENINDLDKNINLNLRNNSLNSSVDISCSNESSLIYFFPPLMPSNNYKNPKNLEKKKNNVNPINGLQENKGFLTPKISSSKSNVFVYNPNNYECLQMKELSKYNLNLRNFSKTPKQEPSKNINFENTIEIKTVEKKDAPNKLIPKPLNLKEIAETKKTIRIEERSKTLTSKNNSPFIRNENENNNLFDKILEKGNRN